MNQVPENEADRIIERIASKLPLLDKTDLTVLTEIMTLLVDLSSNTTNSPQFNNLALRAARLAETIILSDVPFESGCKRLNEAVFKLQYLISNPDSVAICVENSIKQTVKEVVSDQRQDCGRIAVLEDAIDLVDRFIASQQSVLEDLEGKALSLESGSSEELSAIKRMLHTMKGEFGVLNLQEYASLIHQVEAAIERNEFSSENFLRLKDLLGKKMLLYADRSFPGISDEEIKYIFESRGKKESKEQSLKRTESSGKSKTVSSTEPVVNQDPSLLSDFVTESRDHIHNAECLLLELESNQGKTEHLNSIFRACHTIKGVAGFLGLKDIASLAHAMENLMDCARQNKIKLEPGYIDLLLGSMDCLKEFLSNIESSIGGEGIIIPETYTTLMEKLHNVVSEEKEESNRKLLGKILVEKGDITGEILNNALEAQNHGDPRKIGQILIQDNKISEKKINDALYQQKGGKPPKIMEETVRVPVTRLDQLIDAIGEAVIAQSMLTADPAVRDSSSQGLQTKVNQANMILRQIQQLSMSLRMVSVKSTFQKMARLVRDLSKKSEKQVDFIMEGEETEIDKTVVENIGDPLIHMIRNSIDHGIENSSERKIKDKSAVACIKLKAYHKAGNVFIEVSDDGKGLDRESIFNKAIEKGLCKSSDKLSDQEIYDFIFNPGFSTAKQVTDISGRGVGMDVVKKNVEALRGSVEIYTEKDKGTTFTIRLPLTLAIIDGMVVRVCDALYIVPTLSIIETIAAKEELIESVLDKQKMIKMRDNLLPILYLSQLFGQKKSDDSQSVALIVEDALGKSAALMVDEIIGQQQVVIKNLGNGLLNVPGISGGAIMSDGTVSLILDVNGIIKTING